MQAMQAIQPKVKEIQKKYKSNKQKAQEETMKLYKESGVNPLGGCLPLLLQFPILISMYAVIRPPQVIPHTVDGQISYYEIHNNHLPVDSELFHNVVSHQGTDFLLMNLQCSAAQAGSLVPLKDSNGDQIKPGVDLQVNGETVGESRSSLDCGHGIPVKIPYFVMLVFMIGTTFYQQRQMTKASPVGAQSSQQQTILKIMPVMFGIFGFTFPAGLVVYWTTSNLWQIGQQAALLRAGHIGPDALERRRQEIANKPAKQGGMFSGLMTRAAEERGRRDTSSGGTGGAQRASGSRGSGSGSRPKGGASGAKGSGTGRSTGSFKSTGKPKPKPTGNSKATGSQGRTPPQRPKPKRPEGGETDGS
jgi:YidC/Oxa1 family membrane protein insertase